MATSLKSLKANSFTPVIVSAGVSSSVKVTSVTYSGITTAANTNGNETLTIAGSGFNSGAIVYIDANVCNTTYISSTSLTITSPAKTSGSYFLYVYNTDGSSALKPAGIIYSAPPSWVTASGAIAGAPASSSYSQTINATGDAPITYSITSGSLPSGLSLNSSNGAITGTTSETLATSNFTVVATDGQNQTSSRDFSISVYGLPSTITSLVIAGGGGGGGTGAGGGAGGLLYGNVSVTAATTYSITIGGGGASDTAGSNTIFSTATAIGGGKGGNGNGGSGGGGSYSPATPGAKFQTNSGGLTAYANPGGEGKDYGAYAYGAGGGGAGAVGQGFASGGTNTSGAKGWNGGIGIKFDITGTNLYYAGGGGAQGYMSGGTGTAGGDGGLGGGAGAGPIGTSDTSRGATSPVGAKGGNGGPNTGGGGGGSGFSYPGGFGAGGSGVVIIRYPDSFAALTSTTGSPTYTTPAGWRVYTWTSSGSFTV